MGGFFFLSLLLSSVEVRNAIVHPVNVLHHLFSRAPNAFSTPTTVPFPLPHVSWGKSVEEYSDMLDNMMLTAAVLVCLTLFVCLFVWLFVCLCV